jgi:hypothetical protein
VKIEVLSKPQHIAGKSRNVVAVDGAPLEEESRRGVILGEIRGPAAVSRREISPYRSADEAADDREKIDTF